MKRLVFDLTKIPFLKRLISISRLIVEVLNDQNLFTELNLADWFSGYVQVCSGGHFSERSEAAYCFELSTMAQSVYHTNRTLWSALKLRDLPIQGPYINHHNS